MYLVGFIIRIYHDARSPERQIYQYIVRFLQKLVQLARRVSFEAIAKAFGCYYCRNTQVRMPDVNWLFCLWCFRQSLCKQKPVKCLKIGWDKFKLHAFRFIIQNPTPRQWIPCHNDTTLPQVADGEKGLQIWIVAVSMLQKQSRPRLALVFQLTDWMKD